MRDLSLYVHIPFCTRRCSYCSFFHVQTIDEQQSRFVEALEQEIAESLKVLGPSRFLTVFVGGGTPSVLGDESLDRVFGTFTPLLADGAEVTVEVNPEDVTPERIARLRHCGANRVSLGIQSMDPIAQKVLKRCPPETNRAAIAVVTDTFDNVNFDVLLGVPGSSVDILRATIEELGALRPQHFSVYCLEPGGDMGAEVEKFFTAVDPERSAEEYLLVCDHLSGLGYDHYEISNFALPGRESRHNRVYWDGGDYLGVGPGAHSSIDGARFHNAPALDDYFRHVGARRLRARVVDERDDAGEALERVMLAMRTSNGMSESLCTCDASTLDQLVDEGLVKRAGGRVRLTERGFLLANDIILRLCA